MPLLRGKARARVKPGMMCFCVMVDRSIMKISLKVLRVTINVIDEIRNAMIVHIALDPFGAHHCGKLRVM